MSIKLEEMWNTLMLTYLTANIYLMAKKHLTVIKLLTAKKHLDVCPRCLTITLRCLRHNKSSKLTRERHEAVILRLKAPLKDTDVLVQWKRLLWILESNH